MGYIMKYKLSFVMLLLNLAIRSYGLNDNDGIDNYQECLKAHDEVLACYNNINTSQSIKAFNSELGFCIEEIFIKISQKIKTDKYTPTDNQTIEILRAERIRNTKQT